MTSADHNRPASSPAYMSLDNASLEAKIGEAERIVRDCVMCPRECHVNRASCERGFCGTGDMPFVSSFGPHFGEEAPLTGRNGSGTIFFGNCNLGCIFCQNYTISHLGEGEEISHMKLAEMMLSLQETGCRNINLVTPTHQVAAVLKALKIASGKGLSLPLVYNCGGYESVSTLKLLEGIVDIYMPDFKYSDPGVSAELSGVSDYPEVARAAVREMHRQVGDLVLDATGIARRGLLVRHLVLPSGMAGTADFVGFIRDEISTDTYVNIMDQYTPCYKALGRPPLDRRITRKEYEDAVEAALRAGLKRIDGVTI